MKIYFREFEDGDCELGVLETYSDSSIIDVGNFAYSHWLYSWMHGKIPLEQWLRIKHWVYIGEL